MAIETLDLNDPYVPERIFAASYGVVMGLQRLPDKLETPLSWFLSALETRVVSKAPPANMQHWMIRIYVQGIVDFCQHFLQHIIPEGLLNTHGLVCFPVSGHVNIGKHAGFYIDSEFENNFVGRLFEDRHKYDNNHPGFKKAMAEICQRIWELGYRRENFKEIDEQISDHFYRRRSGGRIERYSKKYGLIAYHEIAGRLMDNGTLTLERRSSRGNPIVDIDPSFPAIPGRCPIDLPDWNDDASDDDRNWLEHHPIVIPKEFLRTKEFFGKPGPWVAVDGFVEMISKRQNRKVFGFIRGLAVQRKDVDRLIKKLSKVDYLGNDYIPDEPTDHYTFAGEIPWSPNFGGEDHTDEEFGLYRARVG